MCLYQQIPGENNNDNEEQDNNKQRIKKNLSQMQKDSAKWSNFNVTFEAIDQFFNIVCTSYHMSGKTHDAYILIKPYFTKLSSFQLHPLSCKRKKFHYFLLAK